MRPAIIGILTCAFALISTPPAGATGLTWPSGQFFPSFSTPASTIDTIDLDGAPNDEYNVFVTLAGLVNRSQPRLAVVHSVWDGKYGWITNSGLAYTNIDKWYALSNKYRSAVSGIVVYDTNRIETVNLATAIAGVSNCVICPPYLAATLTAAPYNFPIVEDLRGRFADKYAVYNYEYNNYWSKCTHRLLGGPDPTAAGADRDWIVAVQAGCIYLDPSVTADATCAAQFFSTLSPGNSLYMGWWPQEQAGVGFAGNYGVPTLASGAFENATVYAGLSRQINYPAYRIPAPVLQNKIYVTFIVSDGDNAQYDEHALFLGWANADRGSVPISWTISPLLQDVAPSMLNWYYAHATANDCLIGGPTAATYCYPDQWSAGNRDTFFLNSEPYFERTGLRVITPWGNMNDSVGMAFAANCPSILGLTAQNAIGSRIYNRMIPLVACASGGSYCTTEADMTTAINNASTGWGGSAPLFIVVQADAWALSASNIKHVAQSLNGNYIVVRADDFFQLNRMANGLPPYVGLGDTNAVNYAFSNGSIEGWLARTSEKVYDCAVFVGNVGNLTGSVFFDGADSTTDSSPNSWIYKTVKLATNASVVTFETRTYDPSHGSSLRVRLIDSGGASHTLLDWFTLRDTVWCKKSMSISAYAGQTVMLYFESNDSGQHNGEQRYVDNIMILNSDHKFDFAFNKPAYANGNQLYEEPFKAVDGSSINDSKWCYNLAGDKWLYVDLGQQYNVNRWVVKHAGFGGETTAYNTKNFKLQKSNDGSTWSDVDSVTNNTANVTDRSVTSFGARYVRLYITNSGSDNAARIYGFEVYGPSSNAASTNEAEFYMEQNGTVRTQPCSEGGSNIGWVTNGMWLAYYNVDFGAGVTAFDARVASASAGGTIQIRLDSPTGTLLGTLSVANTGGWQNWVTDSTPVTSATGIHQVYLVFGGGTDTVCNVNWWKFR